MKYFRTPHLPWSVGGTADDVRLIDVSHFDGKNLVYTEKLDGECTVMSRDSIHARSEDSRYNAPWQTIIKNDVWVPIKHDIPEGMFICGENVYAKHSIEYDNLTSYFYVFGIVYFDTVLSWKETQEWISLFSLHTVPILKVSLDKKVENIGIPKYSWVGTQCEGYVVRNIEAFNTLDFNKNVAKCVRENHVQTDEHWTNTWTPNTLRRSS